MATTLDNLRFGPGDVVAGGYRLGQRVGPRRFLGAGPGAERVEVRVLEDRLAGDLSFQERLLGAVRAMSGLSHPNIGVLRDWDRVDGSLVVVGSGVEGTCLSELIERYGALDPDTVHHVLGGVTAALDHAHAHRIVHGTVDADHVWIRADGGVTLAWFGLAPVLDPHQQTSASEDLLALGRLSYQMMCGRAPSPVWRPDPGDATGEMDPVLVEQPVPIEPPAPVAVREPAVRFPAPPM
ncbi:MAG TPA: protein kinase, partial [Actinomycetota bacterium]|nr:protein kinase [Actinomycetota bacterium]